MRNKLVLKINAFLICLSFFLSVFGASVAKIKAQEDSNRQVAIITDNSGKPRTIKYSDLLFQLALQPEAALDPPRTEDLKRVFQNLIALSLITLEVENSGVHCLTASDSETADEIKRTHQRFRNRDEFEKRLQAIGFVSINDDNFKREMGFRVTIQKYLDLRFRSFMIITPEEEENYYRDVFSPEFRRTQPGILIPDIQQKRSQIRQILTEQKAAAEINKFLEFARKRVKIEILIDELK